MGILLQEAGLPGAQMIEHATQETVASVTAKPENIAVAAQMVDRLFDHWCLDSPDRAALLGQPVEPVGQSPGDASVASNETAERMGHLLAIHAQLRTLFPQNRNLVYSWFSTPSRAFDGLTPVNVVRDHGLDGLRSLRAYLARAVDV